MADQAKLRELSPAWEAERIYRAIFREGVPSVIQERFAIPSERLDRKAGPSELEQYRSAMERVSDLEALEVACRYMGRLPLLKKKFRLIVHLAETLPENQRFFIAERASAGRAILAIIRAVMRTAHKLGKGVLLMARLRHA